MSRQPYMVTNEAQNVTSRKYMTSLVCIQTHVSGLTGGLKLWRTKSQLRPRAETEQELRA